MTVEAAPPGAPPRVTSRAAVAIAVAAVVLGVAGRLWSRSDLWLDEALSVNIASLPVGDMLDALARDGHPPLYYLLLHGWIELFGDSTASVRLLSSLFGLAALPLAWLVGYRAGGSRTALAVLVVVATSPFALRYATEARMYSMVMVLVLCGWLAVQAALRRPGLPRLALVALLAGLLALTHYWSFYLLLAVVAALLLAWRRGSPAALRVSLAVGAGAIVFLPWLPTFLEQAGSTGTPWGRPERPTVVLALSFIDWGGTGQGEAQVLGFLLFTLALVAVFGRTIDAWRLQLDLRTVPGVRWEAGVAFGSMGIAVVAGYLADSAFATRYTAVVFPLAALVVGFGLARLPERTWVWVLGAVALLGVVGLVRNAVTQRTQAGEIADYVTDHGSPGDLVAFCPDQLSPAVGRLLPDDRVLVQFPDAGDPRFVDWQDYAARQEAGAPEAFADRLVADARARGATIWLVWMDGYRTLGGRCGELARAIQARTPGGPVVAAGDQFEHANLSQFGPGRTR